MLEIHPRDAHGILILDLSGRLTGGTGAASLSQRVKQLVAENQRILLLNLSGVAFIDSSGVGELVTAFSTAKKVGGMLKLACPTKMVHEVLRMTRILTIIETFSTEAEALASFPDQL